MKKIISAKLLCCLCGLIAMYSAGCSRHENLDVSVNNNQNGQSAAIRISSPDADAAEPTVASVPDGSIYVVWAEHQPGKEADIFLRHFDSEVKPFGEAVRVNPEAGQATAWRGDPPTIKIGADGTIYVGWTARVEVSKGSANDLYLSISRDGGKSFSAPVKVNDDKLPAVHGMHSLEVDRTGRVYFAWLDERYLKKEKPEQMRMPQSGGNSGEMKHQHAEPNREVYYAVSTDAGQTFSLNKKLAGNVCPCCKTSMTAAPDGRVYVSWRQVLEGDFRHIAVSSTTDGGDSFAPPVIISNDRWQIVGCPVSGAGMTVDAAGNLKIVWFTAGDAGTPGIYQTESKDGGKSFSPRVLISDKSANGTPVIVQDAEENYRAVFSATDKNTYSLATENAASEFTEQNIVTDADLPSATIIKDKIFIVFIKRVNDKRNIFLFADS